MFVSLLAAFALLPRSLVEPLANIRTQLDGFSSPVTQMTASLFMDERYFPSHLRHMCGIYRVKRETLVTALEAMRQLGWSWPSGAGGVHVMVGHPSASLVRRVAARSGLQLALLSSYRLRPRQDEGVFLRFGALELASISAGARQLVAAARSAE